MIMCVCVCMQYNKYYSQLEASLIPQWWFRLSPVAPYLRYTKCKDKLYYYYYYYYYCCCCC